MGQFSANPFGLHDMHGNVWEWVQDVWHNNYNGAPNDGSPWMSGGDQTKRVLRGGSYSDSGEWDLRSAVRIRVGPDVHFANFGFRIAQSL